MTERPISADERWTMFRRRDWEHDHGSLVAHGAPAPVPDEQLEVFDVVRADSVECADGWTHAAKIGPLQAEADALRAALERAGRALNKAGWIDESQAALDAYQRSISGGMET